MKLGMAYTYQAIQKEYYAATVKNNFGFLSINTT